MVPVWKLGVEGEAPVGVEVGVKLGIDTGVVMREDSVDLVGVDITTSH